MFAFVPNRGEEGAKIVFNVVVGDCVPIVAGCEGHQDLKAVITNADGL